MCSFYWTRGFKGKCVFNDKGPCKLPMIVFTLYCFLYLCSQHIAVSTLLLLLTSNHLSLPMFRMHTFLLIEVQQ